MAGTTDTIRSTSKANSVDVQTGDDIPSTSNIRNTILKGSSAEGQAERSVEGVTDRADTTASNTEIGSADKQTKGSTSSTADSTNTEDNKVPFKSATYPLQPLSPVATTTATTIAVAELASENGPNQYASKLSLEKLPPELLACILQQLFSPDQLYSAITTSRAIYRAFRSSMVSILASVMEQAIHPAVLPLAILICEESGDKDGVPARRGGYLNVSN